MGTTMDTSRSPSALRRRTTGPGAPDGLTESWRFAENMDVTVQPNVTTADQRYGLQSGVTVVVRDGPPEVLHDVPVSFLRV